MKVMNMSNKTLRFVIYALLISALLIFMIMRNR